MKFESQSFYLCHLNKMSLNDLMTSLTSNSIIYSLYNNYVITNYVLPDCSLHGQMSVYHMAVRLCSSRSHAGQARHEAGKGDLVRPGAGPQGGRCLVRVPTEVSIPRGMDALWVVRPGLVHLLHIGTRCS